MVQIQVRAHNTAGRHERSQVRILMGPQMEFIKLLLAACLGSILVGQLLRIPLPQSGGALNLSDIVVFFTYAVFIFFFLTVRRSIKLPTLIFIPGLLFLLAASGSTILALDKFSPTQILISSLFLVRFMFYFLIAVITYNVVATNKILNWLHLSLAIVFIFALLGIIQIIAFPDLTNLAAFGWDPHIRRVVSSFLDPNFAGAVLVMAAAVSISLFLFMNKKIYLFLFIFTSLALLLTFSRSSYLAYLTALTVIGFVKSLRVLALVFAMFLVFLLVSSQFRSRVAGAIRFDDTAQARVTSWRNALVIFSDYPLFGVGFNTYRFAQASYGFFLPDEPLGGHSGAGSDSSLLLVVTTTGIFGTGFFVFLLWRLWRLVVAGAGRSYLSLSATASFLGLLVHSQFVNSFFFPQIMLLFWFMIGLVAKNDT